MLGGLALLLVAAYSAEWAWPPAAVPVLAGGALVAWAIFGRSRPAAEPPRVRPRDGGDAYRLLVNLNEEVDKIKSAVDDVSGVSGVLAAVSTITGTLSTIGEQLSSAFTELEQLDAGGELETALKEADSCQDIGGSG